MRKRTFFLLTLLLVAVDILIKGIIETFFIHANVEIIPSVLFFRPTLNTDYSYINQVLDLGVSQTLHLTIACIIVVLLVVYYDFISFVLPKDKMLPLSLSLGLAGCLCNIIGIVFLGGILDYIYLEGFFVFDLKDLYINAFIILLLYGTYKKGNISKLKSISFHQYINYRFGKK